MKIVIIGPGALGCLLACGIHRQEGNHTWLLDHNEERARRINHNLKLTSGSQSMKCSVAVTSDPNQIGPADLILLCVKSGATARALNRAQSLFTDQTLLIPLENGISHLEVISNMWLPGIFAAGVTALGATLLGEGQVRHGGSGTTRLGFIQTAGKDAEKMLSQTAKVFNQSGFSTITTSDIIKHIWNKLLVNVGINALTVIHDCNNGRLIDIAEARETMALAIEEGQKVAETLGINLEGDATTRAIKVCRATAENVSSMLQDVRNKRSTEIMAINGALVSTGQSRGLDLPVNQKLVSQIQAIEAGYLRK